MSNCFLTELKGTPLDSLRGESVPFTRFQADWFRANIASLPPFKSLFDKTAELTKDVADQAFEACMHSSPVRMHTGHTSASRLASGLSGSALRVPEIRTGSLVAVSI